MIPNNKIEGVQFNQFNSLNQNLILVRRDAPTPEEKKIVEDIPYSQGEIDFSMLLGERVFRNRPLTYEFISKKMRYGQRKVLENRIKRLNMMGDIGEIYDTHDAGYYWRGKCEYIEVIDDAEFNRLSVIIEFNVYPFLIDTKHYFDDVWDDFDFDVDVANWTKYEVDGVRTITLYNSGDTTVRPNIIVEVTEDGL